MTEEQVILVDEKDNPVGLMEKIKAHEEAVLHRAFSVFVINRKGELLLQQRALHKYHSPGLWTNTCCSHQRPGETNIEAGRRRLREEMGMECELEDTFWFIYRAEFDNGLTEHELDHVLVGFCDHNPVINPDEVADFKWMDLESVRQHMKSHPDLYTEWFKIIFREYYQRLMK
jgi:isopentenyl-diphosphate delta-isomerase